LVHFLLSNLKGGGDNFMAKGIYKKWLESENLLLLQGWKTKGLTDKQIADNIGINVRTLDKWKVKYRQIGQSLKRGKDHANYAVENALLKKALSGNTTAMIFWLKNNYRDKYSDSQKTPLEEQLTKQQIKRAEAETKIAEAKAKRELSDEQNSNIEVSIVMPEQEDSSDE